MRALGFAAVMVALSPLHVGAQDYTKAANAAWCAGALGAYARSSGSGATYLDHALSRQLASAERFFGRSDSGAEILIFENRGSVAAADCNRACAAQQEFDARAARFNASPDCKRIVACLTGMR